MIAWVFLVIAILTEVTATLALQAAVKGSRWWYMLVGAGYVIAFTMLSFLFWEKGCRSASRTASGPPQGSP